MSGLDPSTSPARIDASTRRSIALGVSGVFAMAVVLVFITLWASSDEASKGALAVLSSVVGVFGTVLGYYFAKGD